MRPAPHAPAPDDAPSLRLRALGDGEVLLLLAPAGVSLAAWDELQPALATAYRVLACERRRGPGEDLRADAAAVAPSLGAAGATAAQPAWILAWSTACGLALALARRRPSLVRGLLLVEPALATRLPLALAPLAARARAALLAGLGRPAAAAEAHLRARGRDALGRSTFDALPVAARAALLADPVALLGDERAGGAPGSVEELAGLARPAAVLVGERSSRAAAFDGAALAQALCAITLRVPGASHFAPLDRPFALAATVRQAIARIRAPRSPARSLPAPQRRSDESGESSTGG